jgi:protein involved in polysaccharide export with SLBB domain/capsular polysaccharide biosynthesis protein
MNENQELSLPLENKKAKFDSPNSSQDIISIFEVFIRALIQKWKWILGSFLLMGSVFLIYGLATLTPHYTVTVQLVRNVVGATEATSKSLTSQNLSGLLHSPELVQRVVDRSPIHIAPGLLSSSVNIVSERNSEIISISMSANDPQKAVDLANAYAQEAIRFSPSQWQEKLQIARTDLNSLLERYTDLHPLVIQQRSKISTLEKQLLSSKEIKDFEPLEEGSYLRVLTPATLNGVVTNPRWLRVFAISFAGGLFGIFLAIGFIWMLEFFDTKLKTVADVRRITKLPILATLSDLKRMGQSARAHWAFRTWTSMQTKLRSSPSHGVVCGITSSGDGEGLSTWVNLLANAASQRGLRVLTIGTRGPCLSQKIYSPQNELANEEEPLHVTTLTNNVLSSPNQVTQKLAGPDPQPLIHVPLPGWVWNLERRNQWKSALNHWSKIENLVILVELPPASSPEAILLAENVPNLIWLTDSGKADSQESALQLQTLRESQCNLVGAVVNHAPPPLTKNYFARWFGAGCIAILFSINSQLQVSAQENPMNSEITPQAQTARSEWQKKLTLGPGDVLNISLFGQTDLVRNDVAIGPDGFLSFLEAQDVQASGLTIDELRERIDTELSKYRRAPRTVITPVSYKSKKYYVLGRVYQKGSFPLDRPTTVIEAVSRARGLETGVIDGNTVDVADLSRSFLSRNGKKVAVDFERLFQQGDLTQNISLEPNDYLYFPSNNVREIYVLGEVRTPGVVLSTSDMTVVGAITGRGGFSDKAWQQKVLIIRGSLNHPETFIINTSSILAARDINFKLQPKDIVFISSKPWSRVEDLADIAASAFIEAAVITWTGGNIGPIFRQ